MGKGSQNRTANRDAFDKQHTAIFGEPECHNCHGTGIVERYVPLPKGRMRILAGRFGHFSDDEQCVKTLRCGLCAGRGRITTAAEMNSWLTFNKKRDRACAAEADEDCRL